MKSCILLFSLLMATSLLAQSNIEGVVVDENGHPSLYANVMLLAADSSFLKGAITDETGAYEFANQPARSYLLAAEALGYSRSYSSSFVITTKKIYQLPPIALRVDALALDEVTVTARKPLFEQQLDRLIVNVQQSATNAGATALEVLERSPGISIDRVNQLIGMYGKNGVVVMINGKVNRQDAASLIQMLAGMSAANIDRIELITIPPANFDAEGDAGIINIVLLTQQEEGWNASWTNTVGYGQRPKWGTSGNVFWRSGAWGVHVNLGTNSNYTRQDVSIDRSNRSANGDLLSSNLYSKRPAYIGFHQLRAGVDYQISPKTSAGFLFSTHRSDWELDALTTTEKQLNEATSEQSELISLESNTWNHWMTSFSLQHQFNENKKLSLTTDYLYYFDNNPTDYEEDILDVSSQEIIENNFRSRKETPISFWVATLDFEDKKHNSWQWQAGVKVTVSRFVNGVDLSYLIDQNLYSDENFSDMFTLDEDIFALYWTNTFQLTDAWQLKVGGRYEYLDSRRLSDRDGHLPGQTYGRIFPSLYLSNTINEQQQWSIAYSERITRPNFNTLAPAFFFVGPNTVLSGNPAVRQAITKQLSAEYRYGTAQLSLRLSDDTDPIVWGQPIIDPLSNILLLKAQNMLDRKNASLNLNFPLELNNWWSSRYQLSGNWLRQKQWVEGQYFVTTSNYASLNMAQNFKLRPSLTADLSFTARSPLKYGLGVLPWQHGIDLGIQKSFADGRHKLSFSWTDVFTTNNFFAIETDQPQLDLYINWRYEVEGSVKRISYTWQFGKESLKKEARKSASSEEQGRVN